VRQDVDSRGAAPPAPPYRGHGVAIDAVAGMSAAVALPTGSQPRAASRAERRLAAGLRSRDGRALEAVHAEYGAAVFGFLLHRLRDRAAAEDVFQVVLTEVWRRGGEYDPGRASMLTWVLTIARSRAIDELRRRRPEPVDPDTIGEGPGDAPEDRLLESWRMSHLLRRLPDDERRVLELRFYGELSQTEIAVATGVALGTIKSRMVRGLERLRELLDAEDAA
jgi:RNA polymerase sigma-70 factor, ECF subfamily